MPAGGNDLREASQVDQYVAAVHFAMTTMATVGYGDVAPTTRTERIIAMIIMAVGKPLTLPPYLKRSCALQDERRHVARAGKCILS